MGRIKIDPKQQFSKKLARWTAVFWFVYLTWLSVIILLQPTAALYVVYMSLICTVVMVINVLAYTRNSIMEKLAFTLLDKTQIELSLRNGKSAQTEDEENEEEGLTDPSQEGEDG